MLTHSDFPHISALSNCAAIVILTGAGISAESGIDTFRDSGGLWEQHRVEDVATPEAFVRDPSLVHRFYDMRRIAIQKAQPNAAHHALVRLERTWRGEVTIVTQNVDDLHKRAGSQALIPMHGEHLKAWCTACDRRTEWRSSLGDGPPCPQCGIVGVLRPDIVWFGEMPYHMEKIYDLLHRADLFVSIGTSGAVYPAAGFAREAQAQGTYTLELNKEPSQTKAYFDEAHHGKASQLVPQWVTAMMTVCATGNVGGNIRE